MSMQLRGLMTGRELFGGIESFVAYFCSFSRNTRRAGHFE